MIFFCTIINLIGFRDTICFVNDILRSK